MPESLPRGQPLCGSCCGPGCGALVDRQRKPKTGSFARLRVQAHLPALELDQLARDRQTEDSAAVRPRDTLVGLTELLEDPLISTWLDANACVKHRDFGQCAGWHAPNRDRTRRRELDRV